ncbi:MAG: class I SAM-dependent methyltransferase [Smithellaceae bacterium]|jgi:ubiquinone/menaquinone biosynthesis C-methylase UbiE
MKNNLREIYDKFARTYEENRGPFDMSEVLSSFYSRLNIKRGRLLDLGCGAGEPFAKFFIEHAWTVTGVDFSGQMLILAARYVPEMKTICADMREVDFAPHSFEAITAIYSLFHIPSRDHAALLAKCYRWLRPQGKMLFTYATKEYTGSDEFDGCREFLGQQLYYSHKTPDALRAELGNTGFQIESQDYLEIGGETFLWITVSKR